MKDEGGRIKAEESQDSRSPGRSKKRVWVLATGIALLIVVVGLEAGRAHAQCATCAQRAQITTVWFFGLKISELITTSSYPLRQKASEYHRQIWGRECLHEYQRHARTRVHVVIPVWGYTADGVPAAYSRIMVVEASYKALDHTGDLELARKTSLLADRLLPSDIKKQRHLPWVQFRIADAARGTLEKGWDLKKELAEYPQATPFSILTHALPHVSSSAEWELVLNFAENHEKDSAAHRAFAEWLAGPSPSAEACRKDAVIRLVMENCYA